MPRYIIERSVPGLTRAELDAAARRSVAVARRNARGRVDPELRIRHRRQDLLRVRRTGPGGDPGARAPGRPPVDGITEVSLEISPAMFR